MSQNENMSQDTEKLENENVNKDGISKLVVKKKRINKADILVFGVCLVTSVVVWMYASNLQKAAQENELDKDAIAEVVVDKIDKEMLNKGTEEATTNSTEETSDSTQESSESTSEST